MNEIWSPYESNVLPRKCQYEILCSPFFARQLEAIGPVLFETKYPELRSLGLGLVQYEKPRRRNWFRRLWARLFRKGSR